MTEQHAYTDANQAVTFKQIFNAGSISFATPHACRLVLNRTVQVTGGPNQFSGGAVDTTVATWSVDSDTILTVVVQNGSFVHIVPGTRTASTVTLSSKDTLFKSDGTVAFVSSNTYRFTR